MPASQEYWQCAGCGLSAHVSWLLTGAGREEARARHLEDLERRVSDGERARRCLESAGACCCEATGSTAVALAIGAVVGFLVARLLSR